MAKQIYIDENGNPIEVSGTINNASMLPISANDSTDTKTYIDNVVTSGSNANGYYIKYADGTMICTDGTTVCADGTIICADGTQYAPGQYTTCADGSIICPDGKVICIDGTIYGPDECEILENNKRMSEEQKAFAFVLIQASLFSNEGITKKQLEAELSISESTVNKRLTKLRELGLLLEESGKPAKYLIDLKQNNIRLKKIV